MGEAISLPANLIVGIAKPLKAIFNPPIKAVPSLANFNLFLNIAAAFFFPVSFFVSSIEVFKRACIASLLTLVEPAKGDKFIDSPVASVKVLSVLSSLVIYSPIP